MGVTQSLQKEEARKLYIRSRFYRTAAYIFALAGIVIFSFIYFRVTEGDLSLLFRDPVLVGLLVFPFMPAFVLSWMAARLELKFDRYLRSKDKQD